jgi:hypothetical protein
MLVWPMLIQILLQQNWPVFNDTLCCKKAIHFTKYVVALGLNTIQAVDMVRRFCYCLEWFRTARFRLYALHIRQSGIGFFKGLSHRMPRPVVPTSQQNTNLPYLSYKVWHRHLPKANAFAPSFQTSHFLFLSRISWNRSLVTFCVVFSCESRYSRTAAQILHVCRWLTVVLFSFCQARLSWIDGYSTNIIHGGTVHNALVRMWEIEVALEFILSTNNIPWEVPFDKRFLQVEEGKLFQNRVPLLLIIFLLLVQIAVIFIFLAYIASELLS